MGRGADSLGLREAAGDPGASSHTCPGPPRSVLSSQEGLRTEGRGQVPAPHPPASAGETHFSEPLSGTGSAADVPAGVPSLFLSVCTCYCQHLLPALENHHRAPVAHEPALPCAGGSCSRPGSPRRQNCSPPLRLLRGARLGELLAPHWLKQVT